MMMKKLLPSADYFRNNIALRNDTLLGVCEALGQDLGFNPNFLRVPLGAGIIFAPALMVGIYLALGAIVFASRTFFPTRYVRTEAAPSERTEVEVSASNDGIQLPRAA